MRGERGNRLHKTAGQTRFTSKALHLSLSDHAGTHVDAPCHFNPDPKAASIEEMPLSDFYTSAICLDISHVPLKHEITVPEMEAALAATGESIAKRDTVLIDMGVNHAPHDLRVERVTYISGDTWNVNPITLRRIERLFCKNERAVIETRLAGTGESLTLVPVAAILVACIRLHCLPGPLDLAYRGPNVMRCAADYRKGDEMGWFEHGSTIVMLAPASWSFASGVQTGTVIRQGQPLMRLPAAG